MFYIKLFKFLFKILKPLTPLFIITSIIWVPILFIIAHIIMFIIALFTADSFKELNPIYWWKNDEDGNYGPDGWNEQYGGKTLKAALMWAFRNPIHNYTFHVIGIANKERKFISESGGLWPDPPNLFNKGKHILENNKKEYKLTSYRDNEIECYIGFRPNGAFGIAWRISKASGA